MSYCHDKAIPHSEFLRRWSPEDRAKVFAYTAEHAEVCQLCGTAPWQWVDSRFAFDPVVEVCHGCERKDVSRDDTSQLPPGASIVLIPAAEAKRRRYLEAEREARRKEVAHSWTQ